MQSLQLCDITVNPRLCDMFSNVTEVLTPDAPHSCDEQLGCQFIENLFAHFFSPFRHSYSSEDVKWFLEMANSQTHWMADLNLTSDDISIDEAATQHSDTGENGSKQVSCMDSNSPIYRLMLVHSSSFLI